MHSVPNGSGTSFYCLARRRRRVLSYCGSVSSKSGGGVTDVDDLRLSVRDNDGDDVLKDPWKEKKTALYRGIKITASPVKRIRYYRSRHHIVMLIVTMSFHLEISTNT